MKHLYLLLVSGFLTLNTTAQVCTPTFANGCGSWHANYVVMTDLDWTFDGVDCTFSDYTDLHTTLVAGQNNFFEVESGNWCGLSIWIDLNRSGDFDDTENVFHEGNGGSEVHMFTGNITVPTTVQNGSYLIRVLTSWGSDGFNPGANGSGGCGAFQYGNYQDFTVDITGGAAGLEETLSSIQIGPNPVQNSITISNQSGQQLNEIQLTDVNGQLVKTIVLEKETQHVDVSDLKPGIYFLHTLGQTRKFVKI